MGQPDGTVDEAEELARQVGDAFALAGSLMLQGAARYHRDPAAARRCYEEARWVAEAAGNMAIANVAAGFVASTLGVSGEPLRARAACEEVAARAEAVGDRMSRAMMMATAAMVLADADERAEALRAADRLQRMATELDMHLWRIYVPHVRGRIALASGDAEAALRLTGEAVDLAHVPLTRAEMLPALVEAELAVGRLADADSHLDELGALGQGGLRYLLAWSYVLRARRLRMGGESTAAESTAHEGLNLSVDVQTKTRIVDALEVLGGVAADAGGHEEAVRLFGAAGRVRDDTGYQYCVSERDADVEALRSALGDDGFQRCYEHGRTLGVDEAIAYARRGRGERKRPRSGWASLTRAEVTVAELVQDGLSNADIGRRLLCSARTVQAHLTHIYAKLGVSSRAELAAAATRQQN
jgi:DNA-binding CsgD family transcriptional regulator